jgi:hypothetical protein
MPTWLLATSDPDVATRIATLFGREPHVEGNGSERLYQVLTVHAEIDVLLDGPQAIQVRMVRRHGLTLMRCCNGRIQRTASASNPANVRRPSGDAGRPPRPDTVVSRSSRSPSNWLRILRWVASCWRAPPGRSRIMRPTSGRRYANNSTDLYALASRLTALCIPRAAGRPSPTADPPSRSFPDHSCWPQGSVLLT